MHRTLFKLSPKGVILRSNRHIGTCSSHSSVGRRSRARDIVMTMTRITQLEDRGAALAWSPIASHADYIALGAKVCCCFASGKKLSHFWQWTKILRAALRSTAVGSAPRIQRGKRGLQRCFKQYNELVCAISSSRLGCSLVSILLFSLPPLLTHLELTAMTDQKGFGWHWL